MKIGIIRWDAFYETKDPESPASQVARALSPKEYHHIAPFFSKVTEDGNIAFDEYTQEIWEKEADYAINAGIDYWAYVWYRDDDLLSQGRKHHVQSKKHDKIKMCGIIDDAHLDEVTMGQLYEAMQQDYYLRMEDGRPILYIYNGADKMDSDALQKVRKDAAAAGVKESIYIATAIHRVDEQICKKQKEAGYEAISFYSTGATKKAMPYPELAKAAQNRNILAAKFCRELQLKLIPSFTSGRATQPRMERPVSWAGDYGGLYAQWGTPTEIAEHAAEVLRWAKENSDLIDANSIISYAWNEHDEGGWICPTLLTDEDGNTIYSEMGKPEVDTSILDALTKVFKSK